MLFLEIEMFVLRITKCEQNCEFSVNAGGSYSHYCVKILRTGRSTCVPLHTRTHTHTHTHTHTYIYIYTHIHSSCILVKEK
jgi:hypothetical protein